MKPTELDREALRQTLASQVSGEVRFDAVSRALYSTDASVYQIEPLGVVIPRNRQDILTTLAICRKLRIPITIRGGGTSQAGQAIGEGLQIDISKHYNQVLEVNAEEAWVRVEPGIVLDELNAQLAPLGMRFAPDITTASRATIGGMMANNSSGARSVLYGKTIDHVLEQTVVLADGSIAEFKEIPRDEVPWGGSLEAACYRTVLDLARTNAEEIDRRYPKILRRVGGYNLDEFTDQEKPVNLSRIMVGSEGTLGVVLEAKLKLVPLPKAKALMVVVFHDLLESLAATPVVLTHNPAAVEVMDKSILDYTRQNQALDRIRNTYIEGDPASTLCIEFYGDRKEDLPPRLAALEQDLRTRNLGYAYRAETDPAGQAKIWSLREASLGLSTAMKGDAKSISFVEDTAVAPEKLRDYIERFLEIIHRHNTTAGIYAHASVGCLHVRPVINLKTQDGVKQFAAIADEVANLVLEFGGALSGEHGDGMVRSSFMKRMFGPLLYQAFREIKQTFDPHNLFNPGKIVDSPPLTANLRFGAGYETSDPKTFFDFSEYGGMARAAEMCSGVGACRKTLSGAMCPSFMATRDEAHSTRGRANTLRLAMNGKLAESGLDDHGVFEVLDLCLECRACKSECPVNVDVARLKSEFLAGYWETYGTPQRIKAIAHLEQAARWGSRFPAIANRLSDSSMAKALLHIDPRRSLPKWKSRTFERWTKAHTPRTASSTVTLFSDTFTNHYDPEIGIAVVEILEAANHTVNVVHPACCGRPLISQGLLAEARQQAEIVVDALYPIARRGERILFCEPSCLSAVKEDAPSLLRGELQERAKIVAAACTTFEDYARTLELPMASIEGRILLHGHCHQKSMGLLAPTVELLKRIPSDGVVELDAGCCGMAGSFGYTHYDVSKAIAEGRLLPAVRAMRPGDVLVAPGTSCRHQVADFAKQTRAQHPATLIRSLLK